jgi:hypothetical protein
MQNFMSYLGNSKTLRIPLVFEAAAFTPGTDYTLIFTCKESLADTDAQAKIQKTTGTGLTHSSSFALVTLVPGDSDTLIDNAYFYDVQAQHNTTGAVLTVQAGRLRFRIPPTRELETSVPIYTTQPPAPIGPTGATGPAGPAPSGTGFVKVVSGVLQTPSASIAQSVVTNLTSDLALKTNAQTPVLASAAAGAYLGITSSDPLSGVHVIEDNFAGVMSQFVYRPLGVTEVIYNTGYNIGSIYFWFAGLPDCNTITINDGTSWGSLNLFDAENITHLEFNSSDFTGTFSVPSGLSSLYSLDFGNNGNLNGLNFTAGAHPELSTLYLSGCTGFNTAAVDATLLSLEAANTSTMVGATYTGMGQGTEMTYTDYLSTNVNVRFTRTTANLAQLVVQPTLTLSYLSPTDGPVGLTVAGNTSTGAITAKTVTPFAIAASAISWSVYAYQTKTLSLASYTFTQSGAANGRSLKLYLTQTYVGALSVTWFPTITWSGGIEPTYTNGTTTIVTLVATGTNTFTGSFTTAGTVIAATTGTELITAINANTNASTLVTASSAGTNTGAVGQLALTNLGSLTISKLIARGWTINL